MNAEDRALVETAAAGTVKVDGDTSGECLSALAARALRVDAIGKGVGRGTANQELRLDPGDARKVSHVSEDRMRLDGRLADA